MTGASEASKIKKKNKSQSPYFYRSVDRIKVLVLSWYTELQSLSFKEKVGTWHVSKVLKCRNSICKNCSVTVFLKSFQVPLQTTEENGSPIAQRTIHQIQAPQLQAHTYNMSECNSATSTTNKSKLPPKGMVVLPAFYPSVFFLFKVT